MSLFADISDLKAIVGGAVNISMRHDKSLQPFFDIAHERHIEPWLGTTILSDLETAYDDGNGTLTQAQQNLLPYYRKPLAWLALYEYLPHATVQFSEAGLHRIETDDRKSAYKYQEQQVRDACLLNGYEALEKLIEFLEKNKSSYAEWINAPGYARHHGVLLNTAAAFRISYPRYIHRHIYDGIRGIIEDVEQFAIVPIVGEDQYDGLLENRENGSSTEVEKKVIYLAQRVVAHLSMNVAMRMHIVNFEGDRIVYKTRQDGGDIERTADAQAAGVKAALHDDTANRLIQKLRSFLAENIDDPALADYKAWQESIDAAAAEETTSVCQEGERSDWGDVFSKRQSTQKGVIRL